MLGHPLCANFAITKLFVDYVMHSSFAYRQFKAISRVVIQRFCGMSSSTAEIVALLVTTCACPGRGNSQQSFMFNPLSGSVFFVKRFEKRAIEEPLSVLKVCLPPNRKCSESAADRVSSPL
ncbi:hypothetical protein AVEN_157738-1 [Araneus ventricosus]|uniref:Uncharacterized protein n=1 Tax=Araneus ventricosus TaxID=182803 RepID=A0A4Y2FIW5_ARAVE|nr:hypothetical protein AVEN_157738-1 [Araneus ventricosus]